MKLTKEQRRISHDGIEKCKCGTEIGYVSWRWIKGSPNRIHYAVICPNCKDRQYMWRKKIHKAVEDWNKIKD